MLELHEAEQLLGKARVAEIRASVGEVLRMVLANQSRYARHRVLPEKMGDTLFSAAPQLS
jgi:hypothetical protein